MRKLKKCNYGKKLVFGVLAGSLVLSLTACGSRDYENHEKGVANTDTSQTQFAIMGAQSALSPGYQDNVVLNQLQEEAGISIDWTTMSESLAEQVNIRIAGDELPDAFMGVGFSNYDISRYGDDGTFIDLTPYLTEEYMPNLSKILEENPDIRSAITMDDGYIYGLPAGERMGTAGIGAPEDYSIYSIPQFAMINKAWLDELGLEVPSTLDELYTALKAFKDNDMSAKYYGNAPGSTIPMSTGFDQWCWGQNIFYAGFGFTNWPNDVCNDLVLRDDGTVEFVCVSEEYRKAVTYFHDWYAEGLMDVEMFSQSDTQLISKCSQGYVGVSTWWYIEELMGDYADDYVFLPVLDGPDGTHNVTVRTGGGINSGQLNITKACKSPANLLKFYDRWYDPEIVMQLQYGPVDVYFTQQDEDGVWLSISDEESRERYGKSSGELKGECEVAGPKLILSDYYQTTFKMEDRAIERLTDLYDFWMPYVDDTAVYPVDCVFTGRELDDIDWYRADFESAVSEQEGLWLKNGGPTDEEWEKYKKHLKDKCGMDKLLAVYQGAYDRYSGGPDAG
ncbi:MAG: extracellular solute-binding protein [Lachnospiraceae bacterium]|jgi:putative aldouronate transport system substrate-binding protein|nr:extracellular solute-binding protein [Lachnospiraceae bacterium]